jgi:hypothetical protein
VGASGVALGAWAAWARGPDWVAGVPLVVEAQWSAGVGGTGGAAEVAEPLGSVGAVGSDGIGRAGGYNYKIIPRNSLTQHLKYCERKLGKVRSCPTLQLQLCCHRTYAYTWSSLCPRMEGLGPPLRSLNAPGQRSDFHNRQKALHATAN